MEGEIITNQQHWEIVCSQTILVILLMFRIAAPQKSEWSETLSQPSVLLCIVGCFRYDAVGIPHSRGWQSKRQINTVVRAGTALEPKIRQVDLGASNLSFVCRLQWGQVLNWTPVLWHISLSYSSAEVFSMIGSAPYMQWYERVGTLFGLFWFDRRQRHLLGVGVGF